MKVALFVWLVLAASAAPAFAQQQEFVLGPNFEQRFDELAKWLNQYEAWEKWFEVWGNRVERTFDTQVIWARKKRPEPPAWLAAECQSYLDADGLLANACYLLRTWDDQPLLILQRRRASLTTSAGKADEAVVKTSFFHRVHVTGLWMQARYPAPPAYGMVGMQIGVFETGRFTLPAVGVMVVMVADGRGGHEWKPATTLGFGYRLCDFIPPLTRKPVSLHINVARTSVQGAQDERTLPGMSNVTLFGLSVSAARRHR
jgi:hypothetical protein